jgi:hypothetical protein
MSNHRSSNEGLQDESGRAVFVSADPDIAAGLLELGVDCAVWRRPSFSDLPIAGADEILVFSDDDPDHKSDAAGALNWARRCPGVKVFLVVVPLMTAGARDLRAWAEREGNSISELIKAARAKAGAGNKQRARGKARERGGAPPDAGDGEAGTRAQSHVQVLLDLAGEADLFHAPDMRAYAKVRVAERKLTADDGRPEVIIPQHHEVLGIKSQAFKSWLLVVYYAKTGTAPSGEALAMAIRTLEAKACHHGDEREVYVRVGVAGDRHYIDLGDAAWQVIEVTAEGWKTLPESPIAFRRSPGALSMPVPIRGGDVQDLRKFVNVADDDDFLLMVAWTVFSVRYGGPYVIMIIYGEQGSAKSTTSRVVCAIVDPRSTTLRSEPKSPRDLMITAYGTWLIPLDNLSGVWAWLSDALCRLASGAGYGIRANYTDDEEVHFKAVRPILLNGIDDVAERPDLLDRAILLRLPTIDENDRKEESVFWTEFDAVKGAIFGAILDAYSKALKLWPDIRLGSMPRQADFARFGVAVAKALGLEGDAFLKAYQKNIGGVTESAAEASAVASAIRGFTADRDSWEGTPTALLRDLTDSITEREAKAPGWPRNGRKLTAELTRLAPVLRRLGIYITRPEGRTNKGRPIIISKTPPPPAGTVPSQPSQQSQDDASPDESPDLRSDGRCDGPVTVNDQADIPSQTVTTPSPDRHSDNSLPGNGLSVASDGRDCSPAALPVGHGSSGRRRVRI